MFAVDALSCQVRADTSLSLDLETRRAEQDDYDAWLQEAARVLADLISATESA